jgi:hypothetical protein
VVISTSNATLVAELKADVPNVEALPVSSKLETESCCTGIDLWSALGPELAVTDQASLVIQYNVRLVGG